jgi:hypothetical protein
MPVSPRIDVRRTRHAPPAGPSAQLDAAHIRHRSTRYPGGTDLEPAWTLEAASDPHQVIHDPDPNCHVGYTRVIGYSASAGFVLTVIVDPRTTPG